jgi:hypothetical protein
MIVNINHNFFTAKLSSIQNNWILLFIKFVKKISFKFTIVSKLLKHKVFYFIDIKSLKYCSLIFAVLENYSRNDSKY